MTRKNQEEVLEEVGGRVPRRKTRAVKASHPDAHREVKQKFVEERGREFTHLKQKHLTRKSISTS